MIARLADRVRAALALTGPLGAGSRILLLRLVDRFGWKLVGAGAALLVYAAARYRTWIAWMLLAWAIAAWMHAPGAADEEASEAGEESAVEAREPVALKQLLLDLIGDGHGVHLRTVLAYLQQHGQWEDKTVADLRQHLESLGIPVQPKVKVAGTPTRGVLRKDLEALSPPRETPSSPDGHLPI